MVAQHEEVPVGRQIGESRRNFPHGDEHAAGQAAERRLNRLADVEQDGAFAGLEQTAGFEHVDFEWNVHERREGSRPRCRKQIQFAVDEPRSP